MVITFIHLQYPFFIFLFIEFMCQAPFQNRGFKNNYNKTLAFPLPKGSEKHLVKQRDPNRTNQACVSVPSLRRDLIGRCVLWPSPGPLSGWERLPLFPWVQKAVPGPCSLKLHCTPTPVSAPTGPPFPGRNLGLLHGSPSPFWNTETRMPVSKSSFLSGCTYACTHCLHVESRLKGTGCRPGQAWYCY